MKTNIREVGTSPIPQILSHPRIRQKEGTNDEDKDGAALTPGTQKLEPDSWTTGGPGPAQVAPGPPPGAVTVRMKLQEGQGHCPLLPAFGLAGENRLW